VRPAPGARRPVLLPCPTSRNGTLPPDRSLEPLCQCRLANLNSSCPRVLACAPRRDDCDYVRRITGDLQRTLNEIVQNNRMSVDTTRLSGQFRKGLKELDTVLVELDESLEFTKQQKAMYAGATNCGMTVRQLAHTSAGTHDMSPLPPQSTEKEYDRRLDELLALRRKRDELSKLHRNTVTSSADVDLERCAGRSPTSLRTTRSWAHNLSRSSPSSGAISGACCSRLSRAKAACWALAPAWRRTRRVGWTTRACWTCKCTP